jgi:uncharacterized membrane protein
LHETAKQFENENMIRDFARYFMLTLATFLVLDAFWLGLVAPQFYQLHIGFLLRDTPNWYAAGLFYLIYVAGLTVFVVTPAIRRESLSRGVLKGAFFGIVTYATYDLTNLATIKGWPLVVSLVDLAWGATLCATTTFVCLLLGRRRIIDQ